MRLALAALLCCVVAAPAAQGCKRGVEPTLPKEQAASPEREPSPDPAPSPDPTPAPADAAPKAAPHPGLSPSDLIDKAIAAHGGEAALRRLANVAITAKGVFEGDTTYDARHFWIAPDSWSSRITSAERAVTYGIRADQCWERDRGVVSPCDVATITTWAMRLHAMQAALLVDLPTEPVAADPVERHGDYLPSVLVGDVTLAFHPDTFLLAEVRYPAIEEGQKGTMIERRSAYREAAGVMVPGRVTTSFGRRLLTEEEWVEVTPGAATAADVRPPVQIETGTTVHRIDGPRPVAWTDVPDSSGIDRAIVRLVGLARQRKLEYDASHGLLIAAVGTASDPAVRVAITMAQGPVPKVESGDLRIETWAARSVAGAYYVGDPVQAWSMQEVVRAFVKQQGLTIAAPERWEVLIYNDPRLSAAEEPVALLQVGVEEPPPGD